MQRDVARCHVDASLQTVALLMWNHDCGAIPVVDSADKPVGLVTDRDIAMGSALNNQPLWDMQAEDVIDGRPVVCCRAQDELSSALELMRNHQVRRLPVMDDSEMLVGMVSLSDLIQIAEERSEPSTSSALSFDQLGATLRAVTAPYSRSRQRESG